MRPESAFVPTQGGIDQLQWSGGIIRELAFEIDIIGVMIAGEIG
jgi:hypothetical protein